MLLGFSLEVESMMKDSVMLHIGEVYFGDCKWMDLAPGYVKWWVLTLAMLDPQVLLSWLVKQTNVHLLYQKEKCKKGNETTGCV